MTELHRIISENFEKLNKPKTSFQINQNLKEFLKIEKVVISSDTPTTKYNSIFFVFFK